MSLDSTSPTLCPLTVGYVLLFLVTFAALAGLVSAFVTGRPVDERAILSDIARRRSLSNAERRGEKIKFYIPEDCGGLEKYSDVV